MQITREMREPASLTSTCTRLHRLEHMLAWMPGASHSAPDPVSAFSYILPRESRLVCVVRLQGQKVEPVTARSQENLFLSFFRLLFSLEPEDTYLQKIAI